MTLLVRRGVTYARCNWSRWVADCPSPFCTSALQLHRDQPWFQCWDCAAVAEIVWPSLAIADIERLLMLRPDETTRNWEPGETLFDLWRENIEHGITAAPAELGPGGLVFAVTDDRILIDQAIAPTRRYQIEG